ncbi:acyl carrier protein phosphodiesterase [Pontibacter brevis]
MNFLAHIYLSGEDEALLIGNFIADSVKGKQVELYSPGIAKGIRLHRLIDAYTDTHPIVAESKARLRPKYRKFAPVVADIYYDHFLAAQFEQYAQQPLSVYAQEVYTLIQQHYSMLPARVQHLFKYMQQQNWLLSYAQLEGITQALTGMSRRAKFESGMETAGEELQENYTFYAAEFDAFFPELVQFVEEVKGNL